MKTVIKLSICSLLLGSGQMYASTTTTATQSIMEKVNLYFLTQCADEIKNLVLELGSSTKASLQQAFQDSLTIQQLIYLGTISTQIPTLLQKIANRENLTNKEMTVLTELQKNGTIAQANKNRKNILKVLPEDIQQKLEPLILKVLPEDNSNH